jgi:hypothetical protein
LIRSVYYAKLYCMYTIENNTFKKVNFLTWPFLQQLPLEQPG